MEQFILLDYATLRLIWWLLLGGLLIMFAIMDGFDLGLAALLPFIAKEDIERRVLLNIVGPVWEGNQVWLVTAGGVIFAAWPWLYATAFSSFYLAMMLLLVALIVRPVGFKYRSKSQGVLWRKLWDSSLIFTGWVAPLVFGVAVGNVMLGIPFEIDPITLHIVHQGSFFQLFTPFPLLCGALALTMCMSHGAILIAWKTENILMDRAIKVGKYLPIVTVVLFCIGGIWMTYIEGYHIISTIDPNAISQPLNKAVARSVGGWMFNYTHATWIWVFPCTVIIGGLLASFLLARKRFMWAFMIHAAVIAGVICTFGFSIFPFLLPSSLMPHVSLTIWDASSSALTLWIMLLASIFFLPIISAYTSFIYSVMRGKVNEESVEDGHNSY